MINLRLICVLLASSTGAVAQSAAPLSASLENVKLTVALTASGQPTYVVSYRQKPVVNPSRLGVQFAGGQGFDGPLVLAGSEVKNVDESWAPVLGEVKTIRNHYQQLTVHLRQQAAPGRRLDVVFRVFADGVGFRYEFPKQPKLQYFTVTDELTEFALPADHKAFWIPGDYDTNEYPYTVSKLSEVDNTRLVKGSNDIAVRNAPDAQMVATPLMLKSADGLYVNIHEAAQVDYPAMQLHVDRASHRLTARLVPDAVGTKAYLHAPSHTPWRTLIV
jgi:hypothetical protein